MSSHEIVLFPIFTNILKCVDLCSEYTYKKYLHKMQMFVEWKDGTPITSWTLPVPRKVTKCKKFIQEVLEKHKCILPEYIKYVKTMQNQHVYILLFTNHFDEVTNCFHSLFIPDKDGWRSWKWRTYWHFYTPWDYDENTENVMEETELFENVHETDSQNTEEITETISVYDYIMEETQFNPHHMNIRFPIHKISKPTQLFVTMSELCAALSDIDMSKLVTTVTTTGVSTGA